METQVNVSSGSAPRLSSVAQAQEGAYFQRSEDPEVYTPEGPAQGGIRPCRRLRDGFIQSLAEDDAVLLLRLVRADLEPLA